MMKLKHKFVETVPQFVEEQTLYISMFYATVIHKCCCGCGNEVVTPLSPTDWKLFYDGLNISLEPSIGNWNFDCKSHYWITNNEVNWASNWTESQINKGRQADKISKGKYYKKKSILKRVANWFKN